MLGGAANWKSERTLGVRHGISTFRTFATQAHCIGADTMVSDSAMLEDPALFKFHNAFNPVRFGSMHDCVGFGFPK